MLTQLETTARTVNTKKSTHRRASILLHVFVGAIIAIVSSAAPVHAAPGGVDCAAKAAALVAAINQTIFWQMGRRSGRVPELTEAEFVKVCKDLPPSDGLTEVLKRQIMAAPGLEKHEIVPFNAIPERVRNAFVAAEDADFYRRRNTGFFECVKRTALSMNIKTFQRRSSPSGNSVCYSAFSRALGKSLLSGSERSIKRKLKEMLAAERVETALNKARILQLYLNHVYLGRGAFGVAAAARRHFGKRLSELTVEEAAYLAGLAKAPGPFDAARKYQRAMERRNWVIGQMAKGGYISRQEAEAAAMRPLTVIALSR